MKYDVNSRIINRLELTLEKYLVNRITHTELESYIESSITALESLATNSTWQDLQMKMMIFKMLKR